MTEEIKTLIEKLREFTTTELADGMENPVTMDYQITQRVSDRKIVGEAFTVKTPKGTGGIIPDAILSAKEGDVLVIAGQGFCQGAYWGDYRSTCCKMKGLEGVVIDGAFRDLEGCREIDFPVFAKAITPASAKKAVEGELNVPVECGGVTVYPGDLIVADCNGVVVIKPEEAEAIMERARKKMEAEEYTICVMKETGEILPKIIKK